MHALDAHGVAGNHTVAMTHHTSTAASAIRDGSPMVSSADQVASSPVHRENDYMKKTLALAAAVLAVAAGDKRPDDLDHQDRPCQVEDEATTVVDQVGRRVAVVSTCQCLSSGT